MEEKRNDREIIHCTVLGTLSSAMHVLTPYFLSLAIQRSSPHTALHSLAILSEGSFHENFQSVGETAASAPEESQTCTCLPAARLQAALLLAGVGNLDFFVIRGEGDPWNDGVKGGWNCCPNRAPTVACPIPQGHRMCFIRYCGQSLAPKSWWAESTFSLAGQGFHYLLDGPNVRAYQNQLEELIAIIWTPELCKTIS